MSSSSVCDIRVPAEVALLSLMQHGAATTRQSSSLLLSCPIMRSVGSPLTTLSDLNLRRRSVLQPVSSSSETRSMTLLFSIIERIAVSIVAVAVVEGGVTAVEGWTMVLSSSPEDADAVARLECSILLVVEGGGGGGVIGDEKRVDVSSSLFADAVARLELSILLIEGVVVVVSSALLSPSILLLLFGVDLESVFFFGKKRRRLGCTMMMMMMMMICRSNTAASFKVRFTMLWFC
jgi:hypothetical protein